VSTKTFLESHGITLILCSEMFLQFP